MSDVMTHSPTTLDVPHVEPLAPVDRACVACGADGPHPAIRVMGDPDPKGREHFTYLACVDCGTLQLTDAPDDLGRFYSDDYYSFRRSVPANPLKRRLIVARNRYAATGRGLAGPLIYGHWPYPLLKTVHRATGFTGSAGAGARILDVGCGAGRLLTDLRSAGYADLTGIDPFLKEEVADPGFRLIRTDIGAMTGAFDLIMFNHSLEHIPDPREALEHAARLLAPGGAVSVRVPVVGGEAWSLYGGEWGQLDAPRHFTLLTTPGMDRLAGRAGLSLIDTSYDSDENQFVLSELRLRGIAYHSVDVKTVAPELLSAGELAGFRERAEANNRAGRGDQAIFTLKRVASRTS